MASQNIFQPVAGSTTGPPPQITTRSTHPVVKQNVANTTLPTSSNKFYANLFLDDQSQTVWTHPYSLQWNKGAGPSQSWGMGVAHIDANLRAYGPDGASPFRYFLHPIGIRQFIFSAQELGASTTLSTDSPLGFSINANLSAAQGQAPAVTLPLVQGMGFVTAIYNQSTPLLQSHVLFRSLNVVSTAMDMSRYTVTLEDNCIWAIYIFPTGNTAPITLQQVSTGMLKCTAMSGIIQIAKITAANNSTSIYDSSAGAFATAGKVTADSTGRYSLIWTKKGKTSNKLLMYALPHHVSSFSGDMAPSVTAITMQTTTKGVSKAVVADQWNLFEKLPTDIGFAPWSPTRRSVTTLPQSTVSLMNSVAASEVQQDINAQTNLDSMYFSGKGLAKWAMMAYALSDLIHNSDLLNTCLTKLKSAFAVFVNNQQQNPLVYETVWKGVVSTAGYTDPNLDFGGTLYSDHHFHYGYFVYAAAVIGYLDPSWLTQGTNKTWVNSLVRDFANPTEGGQFFPFSRSFDWFHGHSWAKGLFSSGDGKDQESTSEDAFASYALKMWGRISGDANMEARGNLMLAIQARTFPYYFLLRSDNVNQPSQFIGNKVTGILFENKCDHVTYFGAQSQYVQGIHMIPLSSPTAFIRGKQFVQEEWATYFDNGRAAAADGGWCGLLYANLALMDPTSAYAFFSSSSFNYGCLDGGASRTWYLAFTAALGDN